MPSLPLADRCHSLAKRYRGNLRLFAWISAASLDGSSLSFGQLHDSTSASGATPTRPNRLRWHTKIPPMKSPWSVSGL
jgi:hypothetical protein